jgi:hypothetical protein
MRKQALSQFYIFAIIFLLFQKSRMPEEIIDEAFQLNDTDSEFSRIRCPLCQWQPNSSSLWECVDCDQPEYFYNACGMVWNTFSTHGHCPGCGHQWRWTSCLNCWEWSLHEDWYMKENGRERFH